MVLQVETEWRFFALKNNFLETVFGDSRESIHLYTIIYKFKSMEVRGIEPLTS